MAELQKLVSRVRKGTQMRENDDDLCSETSPTIAIKMVINNKLSTLERASQNDVVIVRQSQLVGKVG